MALTDNTSGSIQADPPPFPESEKEPLTESSSRILTAHELIVDPMFRNIPPKFLLWQEGLALCRLVKKGDILCREGDPGNTAYLIKSGRLQIILGENPNLLITSGVDDIVVGEMACLSGKPRKASVKAYTDCEIWEIRRNVLDRLMRSPDLRARFEKIYRTHSLDVVLRESNLFDQLSADERKACAEFLRPRLAFVRVNPRQPIFNQGDWGDYFYMVRLGSVRVTLKIPGREPILYYCGPGAEIGEIALLALSPDDKGKSVDEVNNAMGAVLNEPDQSALANMGPYAPRWPIT